MASGYYNYDGVFLAASATPLRTIYASSTETLTGGSSAVCLYASGKGNVEVGGSGDTTFDVNSLKDVVKPGTGVNTVSTSVNYTLPDGVQNMYLYGQYAHVVGIGNSAANIITADRANETVIGMGGDDVLISGGGDTFVFGKGSGKDVLIHFQGGSGGDVIRLADYGFTSFSQVQSAMTQVGSDVILKLSPTDLIDFKDTVKSAFTADNFQLQVNTSAMRMTFDDEFSSLSLYNSATNTGTWKTAYAWADPSVLSSHTITGESEVYVDPTVKGTGSKALGINPFSLNNGVVSITAAKTTADAKSALWGHDYTSGLLTTEKSFSQLYGYFDIRAELPQGQGFFPAFWMVPTNGKYDSELDVMEAVNDSSLVYNTAHWINADGTAASKTLTNTMPNLSQGFHDYGVLWTASTLTWYIDGTAVGSMATPASMHTPMYMLIDLALGGSWAGAPDGTTNLSQSMKIDYVRAYALADDGSSATAAPPTATPPATSPPPAAPPPAIPATPANGAAAAGAATSSAPVVTGSQSPPAPATLTSSQGVQLSDAYQNVTLTGQANWAIGNAQNNHIVGNNVGDTLSGRDGDDVIVGGTGADTIYGGTGSNVLTGGAGKDTFVFDLQGGHHQTVTDFGAGGEVDQLDLSAFLKAGLKPTLSTDATGVMLSYTNGETIHLDGAHMSDLVATAKGYAFAPQQASAVSLTISAAQQNITLTGSAPNWVIGTDAANHIVGNAGANVLSGRGGDDWIEGGAGNDTLYGGLGSNTLTGGTGADTFVFDLQAGHKQVVTDFGAGGEHDALNIASFLNANLKPTLTEDAAGTHLSFTNGETIDLLGVHVADLHATATGYIF